jgi:hypothetical protein
VAQIFGPGAPITDSVAWVSGRFGPSRAA